MSDPEYKDIGDPADRIIEECSEVLKAVIKGKRFGWKNHHPDRPESNNLSELYREVMDLQDTLRDLLKQQNDILLYED